MFTFFIVTCMFMVDGIALVFTAQFYMVVFRWYVLLLGNTLFRFSPGQKSGRNNEIVIL